MNASTSIIVWEWEAQPNVWVPYTPKVCQHIESESRRSGKVDLGGQNVIELAGCEIDFTRMRQVNVLTSESVKVRREQYPSDCPFAKGAYWKWFTGFQWQMYDVPTSNFIEDAFQQNARRVDLRNSPIAIPNVIKFPAMVQVNKRTKFSRKIEREETKEQYPQANHETTNMPGQSGSFQPSYNHNLLASNTVIRHGSNAQASSTSTMKSTTQVHYPMRNGAHTKSTLVNHRTPSNRHIRNPTGMVTTQSVTPSLPAQPSPQAHNPMIPRGSNNTTLTNLANHKTPFNYYRPNASSMVTTQSVTPSLYAQPSTQAHNPIMPSASNNTTFATSRGFVPPNIQHGPRFGLHSTLTSGPFAGPNAMMNLNHISLANRSGRLPVGQTPLTSQTSNTNAASALTPPPYQTSTSTPRASKSKSRRKERADALSPTPKCKRSISGPLNAFARRVKDSKKVDDECAICLESLRTPSDYDLDPNADVQCVSADILQLRECKHIFHRICLQRLYESGTSQAGCLRCPTCKTIHGVLKGNQPQGGTMNVTTTSQDIPGYPGCGSIVIVYNFTSGTQGPNHPNPGQPYYPNAFPRTCYLPNNPKGQKVLRLLRTAFDRRLVFTVARSVTTGQDNCIVWNDIHHKTEGYGNGSGYGYPDPNYLDNVLAELASHGVTDDT